VPRPPKPPPPFDLKQHLLLLHKQILPLFFLLCALVMVIVIVTRAGRQGADLPGEDFVGARIGLLRPVAGAAFDPAFATLSPTELVLAPTAVVSGPPRSPLGGEEVRATADGFVVFADTDTVVLVHDGPDGIVESVYRGLARVRVGVGARVRRGGTVGTAADDALRFESRRFPALAVDGIVGGKADPPESTPNRLAPPPSGETLEAAPLTLDASSGESSSVPDQGR